MPQTTGDHAGRPVSVGWVEDPDFTRWHVGGLVKTHRGSGPQRYHARCGSFPPPRRAAPVHPAELTRTIRALDPMGGKSRSFHARGQQQAANLSHRSNGGEARKLTDMRQGAQRIRLVARGARASRSSRSPTFAERRDEDRGHSAAHRPDELHQYEERKRKQEDSRRDPRIIHSLPYRVQTITSTTGTATSTSSRSRRMATIPRPSASPKANSITPQYGHPMVAFILTSAERDPRADLIGCTQIFSASLCRVGA